MAVDPKILVRVCISHFLSTWNSRVFEYTAVLLLASIFPQTLMPPSIYALARALSAILLAPAFGRQVDKVNRLVVVRRTIVLQRLAVCVSCVLLALMIHFNVGAPSSSLAIKAGSIAILSLIACVEKLMSIMNTVSVERDWVVVIAGANSADLRYTNSIMRRIDLFCKMIGPLAISFLIGFTLVGTAWLLVVFNFLSVFVEYFSIARVYQLVPALAVRARASDEAADSEAEQTGLLSTSDEEDVAPAPAANRSPFLTYTRHQLFLPSFALSCLYWNVLSFGGLFVTYMLAVGYSPAVIGILRTVSVTFELAATWLAPIVMSKIGPIRTGLWFLNWETICIFGAVVAIYHSDVVSSPSSPEPETLAAAVTSKFFFFFTSKSTFLVVCSVVLSRLGLWGFDLSAQTLIQEGVEPELRTTFSSVESSFQNAFELMSFASTIVFSKAETFWIPSAMSFAAVALGAVCMAAYTLKIRRHLFHVPNAQTFTRMFKSRESVRETVIQQELDEDV
ncbi:Ferroporti-1 [Myxozyma melibiosi]|uniref:Solute carrier family 40 member n=1 Tax=Myxozyma melibiosi TaxID=54550 RepID=A0ABR1FB19_9ASCO